MQCLFCLFYEYRRDDFFGNPRVITQPLIGLRATPILIAINTEIGSAKTGGFHASRFVCTRHLPIRPNYCNKKFTQYNKLLIFLHRKTFSFKLNNVSLHIITPKVLFTVTIHPNQALQICLYTTPINIGRDGALCGYITVKYRQI